jgi:ubiquinone/menaquinone biosynthesis C-methylase UbiE
MAQVLYETPDVGELPFDVTGLSLGCGDPVTLAGLQPGQTVLDLGSGGGIDCFLAAKQVGPGGQVIGVDMTTDMIERARANASKMEAKNVEFRLGEIEHLPVADGTVDVVISNCVINLSPDKPQVFRDAYRVLRPGGRLAVSDIVTRTELPEEIKQDLGSWAACVAGAWVDKDYVAAIEEAGFVEVTISEKALDQESITGGAEPLGLEIDVEAAQRIVYSARVTAIKPR